MKWIGKKKRRILMGFLNQNFASFFFEIFFKKKKGEKNKSDKTLFTSYFLGVRTKKKKEGRKEGRKEGNREDICVCVCALCTVYSIPTQSHRVWWHAHHLSSLSRRRLEAAFFSGAATKAQSTRTSWSSINFPSMFSIARNASSFSLYSIRQYPFTNPVRRSKFKCTFEISPKSPKFS